MEMDFSSLNPATSNSLNVAARYNNIKKVKKLLKKINVNCPDNRGWTCLHEAAANDSFQCLKLILDNEDVRPLVETHEGHTALYLACRFKSSIETIKHLLDAVPDIANYGSYEGVTPMHLACSQGNIELIQLLIDYGAIIDVQDFDGDTPLHDAVRNSQDEVIAALLHAGADPEIRNSDNLTAFHLACYNGCLQVVNNLFPFVIDINQLTKNGDSPIILAVQGRNDEIVKFLLENGGDPNIENKFGLLALTAALHAGHLPSFKLLLNVTDINKIDKNIILYACMENNFNIEILESLLMLDLGPEYFNQPHVATLNFDPEQVKTMPVYLTNAPINIYLKICEYIYLKSREKFKQFFYLFLMRGPMVDAIDVNECPPLVYIHCCMHTTCFSDVFQILREQGCNVDYISVFNGNVKKRCLPDAFKYSLLTDSSTTLIMLPYSLYCDPEYLLTFFCVVGSMGAITLDVVDNWMTMIHEDLKGMNPQNLLNYVLPLKHLCRQRIRSTIISSHYEFISTNKFLNILKLLKLPRYIEDYLRYV